MRIFRETSHSNRSFDRRNQRRKSARETTIKVFVKPRKRSNVTTMRKRLKIYSESRINNIDNASLHFVQKRNYYRRSISPNVKTVFHTWTNKRFVKMKNTFRSKVMTGAIERTNLHRGRFGNRFDIVVPSKIRRKRQSKTDGERKS